MILKGTGGCIIPGMNKQSLREIALFLQVKQYYPSCSQYTWTTHLFQTVSSSGSSCTAHADSEAAWGHQAPEIAINFDGKNN